MRRIGTRPWVRTYIFRCVKLLSEQAKHFDPDYGKQAGDEEDWD